MSAYSRIRCEYWLYSLFLNIILDRELWIASGGSRPATLFIRFCGHVCPLPFTPTHPSCPWWSGPHIVNCLWIPCELFVNRIWRSPHGVWIRLTTIEAEPIHNLFLIKPQFWISLLWSLIKILVNVHLFIIKTKGLELVAAKYPKTLVNILHKRPAGPVWTGGYS